jgi:type I restriction enzyme M protein
LCAGRNPLILVRKRGRWAWRKKAGKSNNKGDNGANLGFEDKLWAAADKMRGSMDAADYKHMASA